MKNLRYISIMILITLILTNLISAVSSLDILDQEQSKYNYSFVLFQSRWGAQSFKPSLDKITKIELYISNLKSLSSNLIVSIRNSTTGEDLTSSQLPGSEIPTEYSWVEFDLIDISIIPENTYYLIVRTNGGTATSYYKWGFGADTGYTDGVMSYSGNAGNYWTDYGQYDFCFKIYGGSQDQSFSLTTDCVGNGEININPNQVTYETNTIVELSAIAESGWAFSEWSGDLTGITNPTTITMDNDKQITATFTEIPVGEYTLTTDIIGNGTILRNPNQVTYTQGTNIEITAIPNPGWNFIQWSGDLTGITNPTTITMDNDLSITAIFSAENTEDNDWDFWTNNPNMFSIPVGNIGIGILNPNSKLTVAGQIESTTGGFVFPDGTVQTTASSSVVTTEEASVTLIRNSKGNYWEANGANLQIAINDLNNVYSGTVWVGADLTLNSPLNLPDNVNVDFEGHKVTLSGDFEFLYLTDTSFSTVRNVIVAPTADHTSAIIKLSSVGGHSIRYNIFENFHILNTGAYDPQLGCLNHDYIGIHLEVGSAEIFFNTFRDFKMSGCEKGIYLESAASSTSFGNGNTFENIWMNGFVNAVYFDVAGTWGYNCNLFTNLKAQADWYSEYGFRKISTNGNHFDHCIIWDWYVANNPQYCWWIGPSAQDTYICTHGNIGNLLDEGMRTSFYK